MLENKKMWALMVGLNWGKRKQEPLEFDDETWDYIIEEAAKTGINTIVLELGDAVEYGSHPEIACDGAWTRSRVRREVEKCRQKNIALIPNFNFAAVHDTWLGEYHRMICTPTYYRVCNDLIKEVYELFDHPEYIHIGMDEEDEKHARMSKGEELPVYRRGELFWHDLRFFVDCVKDTGAKPWMWSCPLFDNPEEYKKRFAPDEVLLSPWYYNAFKKEHWIPISSRQNLITYYNEGEYARMGLKYVEEDPFLVRFREIAIPLMQEGYLYAPSASVCNGCDYNTMELLEYFKENAPDDQIAGYIVVPWRKALPEFKGRFDDTFRFLAEAKEKFYHNR